MAQDRDPLTVDDLASIYRTERRSRPLIDIRKDFYAAAADLSSSARRDYEDALKKDPGSISSEGTNERRKKILLHIRNIIDIRMEKIASLALLGAMGGDNPIDHLTPEERGYYSAVLDISKKHRSMAETGRTRARPTALNVDGDPKKADPIVVEPVKRTAPLQDTAGQDVMTVRILEDLPVFSGPDRDYDLKKEDVVKMPAGMANALIVREKAVRIDITP
jgi:DNA replication factor GINS